MLKVKPFVKLSINCKLFSYSRANLWSLYVDSFTSRLPPQTKGSLLLHLLRTCASKPPSPTRLSPPPKSATQRVEGTRRAGATRGWAAQARRRTARPATPYRDRSNPAGTCRLYSGWKALSLLQNSWASNRVRMDLLLPEHPAPGCQISTIWRRQPCNIPRPLWPVSVLGVWPQTSWYAGKSSKKYSYLLILVSLKSTKTGCKQARHQ